MKGRIAAGLTAGALSLFSGGIVGHALTISTTTLTSATNPSVWGQLVTFTATITPVAPAPTGTVTFQDSGINVAGCVNRAVAARVASCATAALAVGAHSVTAVYSGNATYATSTSPPVAQVVNMGSTTTLVGSSFNPSVSGQTVTYTATVGAVAPASGKRTGSVDFQDGGVDIAGCGAKAVSAAGTATCAIAYSGPGTHTITAIYSGDANFTGSTTAGLTQTVNVGAAGVVLTSSANPSGTGQNITLTANVLATAPASGIRTGTVDFQAGGVTIPGCSAQVVPASGKATCVTNVLSVGADTITAIYSGDTNFAPSTSAPLTQTVNQGATTTKVVSSLNPSSTGVTVTFTATVTATAPASGTRTGVVAFQDSGVAIAGCAAQVLAAAGTATCATNGLAAGTHTVTAVYSGDGNFTTSTSAPLTQTVVSTTTTAVTSSANPSVFGQVIQYTATVAGGLAVTGTITFRDGGVNIAGCVAVVMIAGSAACNVSPTVASHKITAVYSGDASNAASTSAVMTQVVVADQTTTVVTATVNPTVFGQSVTFTATVTPNAPGTGTPTGKVAFDNGAAAIAGCGSVPLIAGVATCTTNVLTVGAHPIRAVYGGSANYVTSTSVALTETVALGATTTAVASSVNPSVSGQSVTYTATVTVIAPAAGTPTGKVNFEDGGVTIAGCGAKALAGAGTATCSFIYGGAGTHVITAIYTGDASFATSTSPVFTQNVNTASTVTAVASSVNPSVTGQAVTITAVVNPIAPGTGAQTGTVMFEDGGTTITGCAAMPVSAAGLAMCAAAFATAGAHSLTAVYSGDSNFSGSTSPVLIETVNQGATTTVVGSSVDPSVSGQGVTYTATVSPLAPASGTPTGTAGFMDGATTIGGCAAQPLIGGVASCSVVYPGAGSHAITAIYSGDPNFTASTSPLLTQTVNPASTSTSLASSPNPTVTGEPVTLIATVSVAAPGSGAPTGTVAFLDGGTTVAGCAAQPVSGTGMATCATAFVAVGSDTITAVYSGDADFNSSTSAPLTQTINQGATATLLISAMNPSVSGEGLSYVVTVTAVVPAGGTPTGSVEFLDGAAPIGGCAAQALVAGITSCVVMYAGVGSHAITAIYSGDPNFMGSTSSLLTQTVNPASTSTSVGSSVNPSVTGQPVTLTATVTVAAPGSGSPTGTVAFKAGGTTIAGCAAQAVTGAGIATCATAFVAAGSDTVTALYSGDADFDGSTSAALTQTVNQGGTTTLATSTVDPSVTGQNVTYTAAVIAVAPAVGVPTGTATFLDGATTISGCIAQPLVGGVASCSAVYAGVGVHAITALYTGDANFTASSSLLTQTIIQGATVATIASSVNPTLPGQGVSYTVTVSAVAPASGTPTGTVAFLDAASTIIGCTAQPLVAGVATCNATYLTAGIHTITAAYGGDANFTASTSPGLTQTVDAAPSVTTVTSPAHTWVSGQAGMFKATVSPAGAARVSPTGTAAFMDAGAPIPGCAARPVVAGAASCHMVYTDTGIHPITAVYSGDAALLGSRSTTFVLSVYDDPPTPDTGTPATPSASLAYVAILGGVFLVFLVGCVRLRRRENDRD